MSLKFLEEIKAVEDKKAHPGKKNAKKEWNPAGLAIRVWKTGAIYPSQMLVDRFSLEYSNKPAEGEKISGKGLDIFKSADFASLQTPKNLILVNITPKKGAKVDTFGTVGYEADGKPTVSVMEQGATTFGKNMLLPMINEVYGVALNEEGYVDLVLLGQDEAEAQVPLKAGNIVYVPKAVSRGDKKGEATYERREQPQLFVLYPATMLQAAIEGDDENTQAAKAIDKMVEKHADAVVK